MAPLSLLRKPYISLLLLVSASPLLVASQQKSVGWLLLGLSMFAALLLDRITRDSLLAVATSLAIIAITPINTNLAPLHLLAMSAGMTAAVIVPYLWLERWRHYGIIQYKMRHGRRWYFVELLYVFIPALIGYFVVPILFRTTADADHWGVVATPYGLTMLLLGLVVVGVWDELIFVATIAAVIRRYVPFWLANVAQAVIFSSFLYSLGFQSWGVIFAFIFALTQCYIFKVTNSLIYAITIHVAYDLVLYLALIHAHYPQYLRIFVTG